MIIGWNERLLSDWMDFLRTTVRPRLNRLTIDGHTTIRGHSGVVGRGVVFCTIVVCSFPGQNWRSPCCKCSTISILCLRWMLSNCETGLSIPTPPCYPSMRSPVAS